MKISHKHLKTISEAGPYARAADAPQWLQYGHGKTLLYVDTPLDEAVEALVIAASKTTPAVARAEAALLRAALVYAASATKPPARSLGSETHTLQVAAIRYRDAIRAARGKR